MNLTQRQLQAFLEVARLGSFTRAAERLHITQSGLSAMMRDLEAQLNSRLFDRTTRSVELTNAGAQLVPVASRILADLEAVAGSLDRMSTRARRILTVGATPFMAASVLPRACRSFAAQHPQISLRVRDLGREQIQQRVADGVLDVGFGAFFKPASGIQRVALGDFPLAYVCRAAEAQTNRAQVRPTRWAQLRGKPLIGLNPDNPVQQLIEEQLRRIGRTGEERPAYENVQTVLAMVEAGFGAAILPSFIAPARRRYRVRLSVLVEPEVSLSYYRITKKGRQALDGVDALAEAIRAEFSGI